MVLPQTDMLNDEGEGGKKKATILGVLSFVLGFVMVLDGVWRFMTIHLFSFLFDLGVAMLAFAGGYVVAKRLQRSLFLGYGLLMGVVAALGAIGLFFALASDLLVFSLNDSITTLSLLIVTLLLQTACSLLSFTIANDLRLKPYQQHQRPSGGDDFMVVLDGAQPGPLGVPLGEREEFAFSSGADSGMEMGSLGDTKASPSSSFEHPASAYSAYEPASHGSMPVYNPTTGGFGIHPESSERVPQLPPPPAKQISSQSFGTNATTASSSPPSSSETAQHETTEATEDIFGRFASFSQDDGTQAPAEEAIFDRT